MPWLQQATEHTDLDPLMISVSSEDFRSCGWPLFPAYLTESCWIPLQAHSQNWSEVLLPWPNQEKSLKDWELQKAFRGQWKALCWWVPSTYVNRQGCHSGLGFLSEPLGTQPETQMSFPGDSILLSKGGVWLQVPRTTAWEDQRQVYPSISTEASWFCLRHWLKRRVVHRA